MSPIAASPQSISAGARVIFPPVGPCTNAISAPNAGAKSTKHRKAKMKPAAYSLTKNDISGHFARTPHCGTRPLWTHYLLTQAEAKFVAASDNGAKLCWSERADCITAEYGDVEYIVRPVLAKPVREVLSEIPAEPKKPRKKPAAK